jgi:predicted CoA-substrate-specific enzyme activase
MTSAGLDVGSRTISLVLFDRGVMDSAVVDTGVRPLARCRHLLKGRGYQRLVVTGYGRHLVAPSLGGEVISEISAFAVGARHLYPEAGTVIDIGGQDSKVILLSEAGAVERFEMNDRCAAGTGRFLEVMAHTLEVDIDEFGELALGASKVVQVNSLCTVFAESEVVSLIARGEEAAAIARALHQAVAKRITGMMHRVGLREEVIFAGGVARNRCLGRLLSDRLGVKITVPDQPQTVGALGAALLAGGGE